MKFVLMYRQCLNEVGWYKRREHLLKCGISDLRQDEIWSQVLGDGNEYPTIDNNKEDKKVLFGLDGHSSQKKKNQQEFYPYHQRDFTNELYMNNGNEEEALDE